MVTHLKAAEPVLRRLVSDFLDLNGLGHCHSFLNFLCGMWLLLWESLGLDPGLGISVDLHLIHNGCYNQTKVQHGQQESEKD